MPAQARDPRFRAFSRFADALQQCIDRRHSYVPTERLAFVSTGLPSQLIPSFPTESNSASLRDMSFFCHRAARVVAERRNVIPGARLSLRVALESKWPFQPRTQLGLGRVPLCPFWRRRGSPPERETTGVPRGGRISCPAWWTELLRHWRLRRALPPPRDGSHHVQEGTRIRR